MEKSKSLFHKLPAIIGLDHAAEKYAYANTEEWGIIAKEKAAEKWVRTTCGYCSVGCGMFIGVRDGKAVSVKGDPGHPVNYGKLCPKGLAEHHFLNAENRAKYPLLHKSRVSWNEALNVMVQQFRQVQQKYGNNALGVISTGQLVTEEFYALGKLVQLGFNTRNYDGNTTLCMASAVSGYKRSFGSDGPPGAYEDMALADCILLIGANIADNHPILTCWLAANENPNKHLIVADPRATKTAQMADTFLPLKPRSDVALLNGIMHLLVRNGSYDKVYIEAHTTGFDALVKSLDAFTPEHTAAVTGLPVQAILKTAAVIAQAKALFVGWSMGVNHSDQGTETVNAINNLCLMTKNIGRPGAAPFSITGQCNAMGTRETSCTTSLPGYRKFESLKDREDVARLWNVDITEIPDKRGYAYPDIIEAVVQGEIKALWIIATNPIVSFPNQQFLRDALSRLEFLVVQDGFHPTPTTELADLVLPAAIWGEKEGTYTNSERRVSKANKAVNAPGEAMADFDIFLELSRKLGVVEKIYPGWRNVADAFGEWRQVSKGRLCDYSGISYELLDQYGGIQWPFPAEGKSAPEQTRRLYGDGVYQHDDQKAKFFPVINKEMPELPDEQYPFVLNTGRTVEHWHTMTKTANVEILQKLSPEAWVEMNPADAERLGLRQGEYVRVVSRRGTIEKIALRITGIIGFGQVFIPFHWFRTNANNLTLNAFDPYSREPNYKQAAVRVEKASG